MAMGRIWVGYCIIGDLYIEVFQHTTPPKLKDLGVLIISCIIGDLYIEKALLDLGANANLLPSSVYDLFGFDELKSILIILQLADRSIKVPHGMI